MISAPLSVSGAQILDANGSPVRLAGVNWGGAQQDGLVPAGLDKLNRNAIAERVAGWGLNHVRFPFALGSFVNNDGTLKTGAAGAAALAANTDLVGQTPWEVYQACVTALTSAGLAVIPNQMLLFPGWPVPQSTQILTRAGWKSWDEVEPGADQTLGRADDGSLQWTPVLQVRSQQGRQVIRIGTERWSAICTPDHRWLVQEMTSNCWAPDGWSPVRAESASQAWCSKRTPGGIRGVRRLVLTGYADGGKSPCTPDEARIIAWILGGGNLTVRSESSYQAYIAQSASKYATEVRALVTRTGFLSSEVTRPTGHGREVCLFRLKNRLVRELWKHLDEGLIPFVLSLTQEARAAWLDAWRKAEGSEECIYQEPGERQEAVALTGFLEGYLPRRVNGSRHHGVALGTRSVSNGPNCTWIYEDAGISDVWCPTTGLGSWVARDAAGNIFLTGNCCSDADNNGLWYNGNWPASTFAACWTLVAKAFASNPLVIGYDLHNEPRQASVGGKTLTPSWGDGDAATDMQAIYSSTAAALRVISGSKLFFCEGLNYAGDLTEAGAHPVTGPDVVYSLHDYSWYHAKGQTLTDYYNQMDANGGYLMLNGTAPLYIGEFGQNLDTAADMSTGWLPQFLSYCNARTLHWCWWELSAQMVLGTQPVTNIVQVHPGDQESYGLMQGQDWLGDQIEMLALLRAIM
jgi:hypothetical protein